MSTLARLIYNLDKAIFQWLRFVAGDTFLDDWTVISGIWVFWTPLFIFLGVLIYNGRPKMRLLNVFFGLSAFILAFQAAVLLSMIFLQPAPYVVENIMHGSVLPAFRPEYSFNLPDWTTAVVAASLHYARLRLRDTESPVPGWTRLVLPILVFSRVLPGYAYPVDALVGVLVGTLMGFLMHQFARSLEVVMRKAE